MVDGEFSDPGLVRSANSLYDPKAEKLYLNQIRSQVSYETW